MRSLAFSFLAIFIALSPASAEVVEASFPEPQKLFTPASETVFHGAPARGVYPYDSGESAWIARPWDTVLFHGEGLTTAVDFEASRKDKAGRWSSWEAAQIKTFGVDGRFWGKIAFPNAAPGAVRVRAVGPAPAAPEELDVQLVEVYASGEKVHDGENPPPVPGFAPRGVPGPLFHPRGEWGAKITKTPYDSDVPVRITIHHTDTPRTHSVAESERDIRFIQEFHQDGRGWDDIAYHFLIDSQGNIFEGRPLETLGAHTHHDNLGNIGIALLGTHGKPRNEKVTPQEFDALVTLTKWLVERYGIDPALIRGHRDYVTSTACPGQLAYNMLPELRRRVSSEAFLRALPPHVAPHPPLKTAASLSWDGVRP